MKMINIERLKVGDIILVFDPNLLTWSKCEVIQVEKYLVTLKDLEGSLRGVTWYETMERLKDPDHYRMTG